MTDSFHDAALVLVGHGTTLNAGSCRPVLLHAEELRRRNLFARVLPAFWKQKPSVVTVVRAETAPRVFIVPLFISEGYFCENVIPRELGLRKEGETTFVRVQRTGGRTLYYCRPVGTHDHMTSVLLARARGVMEQFPFPRAPKPAQTALFIAGHGTGQNENSRQAIERQVELIRALGLFAEVRAVFLEEEPRIGDCYRLAQAKNIVMVPFFISDGLHSVEDIPILLGEPERVVRERLSLNQPTWRNPTEREGKRLWYTPAVGTEPVLAEVILDRIREAAVEAQEAEKP